MVKAAVLRTAGAILVGSNPTPGTTLPKMAKAIRLAQSYLIWVLLMAKRPTTVMVKKNAKLAKRKLLR